MAAPFKIGGTAHFGYKFVQQHGGFNSDDNQTYNLGRIRLSVAATLPNALDQLPPLVRQALEISPEKRNSDQQQRLFAHWRETQPDFTAETAKPRETRLLARGARLRVPAETVRDIQLATSGLLDETLGGRSVFPPAPAYLFQRPVSYGQKEWIVETDSNRYRRALYTFRFRSVPYPMLVAFDAPNGSTACVRRTVSTTPLAGARHAQRTGLRGSRARPRPPYPNRPRPAGRKNRPSLP